MTLTIDNILDEMIEETGGDTTDSSFKTLYLRFLKEGIRHIPALRRNRLFVTHSTKTLAVSASSVDLSTLSPGFIRERSVWWVTSENKRHPITRAISNAHFNRIYSPNSLGDPRIYRVYDKTMEFDRSASVQRTIGIEYFKEVSAVLTTDTFFGNDSLLSAVKHFSKMVYYGDYEEDLQKKKDHQLDGERIISELEADDEASEMGGSVEQTDC